MHIIEPEAKELQTKGAHLKIGFFDIDGTLLSFRTHEIAKSALFALEALHKKGILLYIASGRAPFQLPKNVLHGEGGFQGFDGFLCNSGQICMDMRGVFRKVPLDEEDIQIVKDNVEKNGFDLSAMTDARIFVNHKGPRVRKLMKEANVTFEDGGLENLGDEPLYQMNAFVTPEEEPLVLEGTKHVQAVRWCDDFVDIIPLDGGKDEGIKAVLEHAGFTREQAFSFGDGGNDATMLAYTGIGIAMGNADFRAKDRADLITTSTDENGIYNACVALGLLSDELGLAKNITTEKITDKAGRQVLMLK